MRKKLRRKVHISGIPDAENHAAMKESIPYSGVWKGRFFWDVANRTLQISTVCKAYSGHLFLRELPVAGSAEISEMSIMVLGCHDECNAARCGLTDGRGYTPWQVLWSLAGRIERGRV